MELDIIKLAKECPGVAVTITAGDLVKANSQFIADVKRELTEEISRKESITYLTREMVVKKLNVDPSTLWRWKKRGYLVPINVGGQLRYKSTDIDKILEG